MGVTPGEADVEGGEDRRETRRIDPLDINTISKWSDLVLEQNINLFEKERRRSYTRLLVSVCKVSGSDARIPAIAAQMGITGDQLYELLTSTRRMTEQWEKVEHYLKICGAQPETVAEIQRYRQWYLSALALYDRAFKENMERRHRKEQKSRSARAKAQPEHVKARTQRSAAPSLTEHSAMPDAPGHNSKPDPLQATSEEQFVDAMNRYRIWAGNPSLREMAHRCEQEISHSTFRNMLNAPTVPNKLKMVDTFVRVLGGTEEDRVCWATAWRHFTVPAPGAAIPFLRLTGS